MNSKLPGCAASTAATINAAYSRTIGQMFEPRTTSAIVRFGKSCLVNDVLISRNHHPEAGGFSFSKDHPALNFGPTHLQRCRHNCGATECAPRQLEHCCREKLSLARGARQIAVLRCVEKDSSNVLCWHAGELFLDFCDVQSRFEVANDGVRRNPETVNVQRTMKVQRITLDDWASRPVDFFGYQHTFSISQGSTPRRERRRRSATPCPSS